MREKFRSRYTLLAAASLLFAIGLFSVWYFREIPQEPPRDAEVLMRNVTWNTNLEPFTPYQKQDELEFVYIAESTDGNRAGVDISKLEETIEVTQILVNDEPRPKERLGEIPFDTSLVIKIRGKAKNLELTKEKLLGLIAIRFQKLKDGTVVTAPPKNQNFAIPSAVTVSDSVPAAGSRISAGGISSPTPSSILPPSVPTNTGAETVWVPDRILSSNIDQLVPLTGKNLESVDRVIVGEKSFAGILRDGTWYFTVPKNTFGNGEFFLGLYLKNGQLVPTNAKLAFTFNGNPINVAAITPIDIKNDQDRYVVVQGNGFQKMISIQLSNNLIFKNALFTIINDNVVSIKVPKWLDPWRYYFNIMDTAGIYEAKNLTFTVTP